MLFRYLFVHLFFQVNRVTERQSRGRQPLVIFNTAGKLGQEYAARHLRYKCRRTLSWRVSVEPPFVRLIDS